MRNAYALSYKHFTRFNKYQYTRKNRKKCYFHAEKDGALTRFSEPFGKLFNHPIAFCIQHKLRHGLHTKAIDLTHSSVLITPSKSKITYIPFLFEMPYCVLSKAQVRGIFCLHLVD